MCTIALRFNFLFKIYSPPATILYWDFKPITRIVFDYYFSLISFNLEQCRSLSCHHPIFSVPSMYWMYMVIFAKECLTGRLCLLVSLWCHLFLLSFSFLFFFLFKIFYLEVSWRVLIGFFSNEWGCVLQIASQHGAQNVRSPYY